MHRSLLLFSRCNHQHRTITTSACRKEYIYGLSSVQAALQAEKRTHLNKLYIQQSIDRYNINFLQKKYQENFVYFQCFKKNTKASRKKIQYTFIWYSRGLSKAEYTSFSRR